MVEYAHIPETSSGDLYRRLYAIRSNYHIIPTGVERELQRINHVQTGLFYFMSALAPRDLEHEQDGQSLWRGG
jgi:hypothetical protein